MKPGTPLPWVYAYGQIYAGENNPEENYSPSIAKMDRDEPLTAPTERDQNAAYIVHAANLYPRLVDRCQSALNRIEQLAPELEGTIGELRAILAECEES